MFRRKLYIKMMYIAYFVPSTFFLHKSYGARVNSTEWIFTLCHLHSSRTVALIFITVHIADPRSSAPSVFCYL
jgi:hypothetical protein